MRHFIKLDLKNVVIAELWTNDARIPIGYRETDENRILSGMKWNGTTFERAEQQPMPEPENPLDTIQEQNLAIMEAIATTYEEQQERDLVNMEIQATIYETLLEIQEGGIAE